MCGRFSLIADLQELGERFGFDPGGLTHPPRYNAAPTQPVLAVMNGDGRHAEHLRWGLIPSWARSASVGSRLINARAETLAERPAFRAAFARRRCLVLADGFYEWRRVESSRIPMRIVMKSGEPFAFAGLSDSWRNPEGEMVRSCTIITTEPNELLQPIHDRMPVILAEGAESLWLDDDVRDPGVAGEPAVALSGGSDGGLPGFAPGEPAFQRWPRGDCSGRGRPPAVPERSGQPEAVLAPAVGMLR